MNDLIEALQILAKYGNPRFPTSCEHDVMYVYIPYEDVSYEDKTRLHMLGFTRSDGGEGFQSYRFGSA